MKQYHVHFQTFDAPGRTQNGYGNPWDYAANARAERNALWKNPNVRRAWIMTRLTFDGILVRSNKHGATLKRDYMSVGEVADLQTGDRVWVTWSGGNGPCPYIIHRGQNGSINCYIDDGTDSKYVNTLWDPHTDKSTIIIIMIHKVWTR